MADTVTSKVNFNNGQKYYSITITNVSDGTGESDVVKIDKSALIGMDGTEPSSIVVDRITGSISGFTSVTIERARTVDDMVAVLGTGFNFFDWRGDGGNQDEGSGSTGDLKVTTAGAAAGATYTIYLECRLKD